MVSRRSFLTSTAAAGLGLPAFRPTAARALETAHVIAGERPPGALADDETYWREIQGAFDLDRTLIYLNSGGCSPTPSAVLETMIRDLKFSNEAPTEHLWNVLEPRVESVRRELAAEFGCDPEEIAITRNSSEANEIMIQGLDLHRGDEVITTAHNYPRMRTTWDKRARREGIVIKQIDLPVLAPSDDHVVRQFAAAITPRTRAIELPHVVNFNGQILPIRKIVALARQHGIEVFVDGAHSFAHIPFTRDDLGCDYFGTSLHKWLLAPIGTGFLYVRKAKQRALWPLMAAPVAMDNDIRKFEEIGTHPAANHNAVIASLIFHRGIGADRKIARLRYLRDRWAKRLPKENSRVKILTPLDDARAGAIALFQVDGLDGTKLHDFLWSRYRIVAVPITTAYYPAAGVRVTPNVFTTPREIDVLCEAVLDGIKKLG